MRPIWPKIQLKEQQNDFLASQIEHENLWAAQKKCALRDIVIYTRRAKTLSGGTAKQTDVTFNVIFLSSVHLFHLAMILWPKIRSCPSSHDKTPYSNVDENEDHPYFLCPLWTFYSKILLGECSVSCGNSYRQSAVTSDSIWRRWW